MNRRLIHVFLAIKDRSAQVIHSQIAAMFGWHAITYSTVVVSRI
jgi:hypothetical protein